MSYLDRLKQLENGEIFHNVPEHEPTEPTKGASDGFVGSTPGAYENIHTDSNADETGNQDLALWAWLVVFSGYALEVYCHPVATREEVQRKYPAAILIEPLPACMHAHDPNKMEADA